MRLNRLAFGLCAAALAACSRPSAATSSKDEALNSAPSIGDFVLYAERSVQLGTYDHIGSGDIGVVLRAASDFGSQLVVGGHDIDVHGNLIAPSVALGTATHAGDIQTDVLQNNGGAFDNLYSLEGVTMPPLPLARTGVPSSQSVSVETSTKLTLSPGTYGAASVAGVLFLAPGEYTFASLSLEPCGRVYAMRGGVTVHAETVTAASSSQCSALITPVNEAECDSNNNCTQTPSNGLALYVWGTDSTSTAVVSIGDNDTVRSLVAAPHGTIAFGDQVVASGAFTAFDIIAGTHVQFNLDAGFVPNAPGEAGAQALSGYVLSGDFPIVGAVRGDSQVAIGIGLPMRNESALTALADDVSNPASPLYRQFLSRADFLAEYAPSDLDYSSLMTWAAANGLAVTSTVSNRLMLGVSGTATQIEDALHMNLVIRQRADGTRFVAVDRDPSVDLATTVLWISGLAEYLRTPLYGGETTATAAQIDVTKNPPFMAADLRAAYLSLKSPCSPLFGEGQTIGIFSLEPYDPLQIFGSLANGDPFDGYVAQQGVRDDWPQPSRSQVGLTMVSDPDSTIKDPSMSEMPLDIAMVLAMAPKANIQLYVGSLPDQIFARMVDDEALSVVSVSYEINRSKNMEQSIAALAALGVSVFVGSGDDGEVNDLYTNTSIEHQTVVGGTELNAGLVVPGASPGTFQYCDQIILNESSCYFKNENAWIHSGGGEMRSPIPFYQDPQVMSEATGSPTLRNYPDVSMPSTGLFYIHQGVFGIASGTSGSAPLWAGFAALANEYAGARGVPPIGFLNPAIYAIGATRNTATDIYGQSFNDVSDSSENGSPGFKALAGYDLATGWGSPRCGLIEQLGTLSPTAPQQYPNVFIHVATGADGLKDSSDVTLDILDKSLQPITTFNLKGFGEQGWSAPGSVHDFVRVLASEGNPLVGPISPYDVGGVVLRISGNGEDDSWDVAGLSVQLTGLQRQPYACVANLSGNRACDPEQPSCANDLLLDGTTGVVRLNATSATSGQGASVEFDTTTDVNPTPSSGAGCPQWGGIAPSQPIDEIVFRFDTGADDLKDTSSVSYVLYDSVGEPIANGDLGLLAGGGFADSGLPANTEVRIPQILETNAPLGIDASQIASIRLTFHDASGNPDAWSDQAMFIYGVNTFGWERTCLFSGTQVDSSTPEFTLSDAAQIVDVTAGQGCL